MATAKVSDEIAASIERVWECFADFGDLSAWAPGSPRVTVEGTGVGSVRIVQSGDQPPVRERLVSYDAAAHAFSYAIVESPFPFTDYIATVRLAARGPEATAIEWSSTFAARGLPEERLVEVIENTYRTFIARLKETLGGA